MKFITITQLTRQGLIPTLKAEDSTTPNVFSSLTTGKFPLPQKLYVIKRAESKDLLKNTDTTIIIRYIVGRGHMKNRKLYNAALPQITEAIANLQPDELFHLEALSAEERLALMGVSDKHIYYMTNQRKSLRERGYSEVEIDEMLPVEVTDKDLSKQAGNSIVVPVIYEIFKSMFIKEDAESTQK